MIRFAPSICLSLVAAVAVAACKDTSAPVARDDHSKQVQATPKPAAPASHGASSSAAANSSSKQAAAAATEKTTRPAETPVTKTTPIPTHGAGPVTAPAADSTTPANFAGLHNVVTYYNGMFSGSVPEGEEGFESLEKLGVKTIISVDGSAPDVEGARTHGMRYVHFPVGYKGVSPERTLEIARAIHDLPGPVYLHCHHGKHRSAGALGAALVTLGDLTPEQATARMKVSGTAESYKGLYQCVADARPVDAAKLNSAPNEFPSVTKTSGFVETMVVVDEEFDQLKAIEKAKWGPPADHPDLVPSAVAGRLENLFRGLQDDPDVQARPDDFKQWLKDSAVQSQAIEDELSKPARSMEVLAAQFKSLTQSCKQCHVKYRD